MGQLFKLPPNQVPVWNPCIGMSFGHTSQGYIYRNDNLGPKPRWFLSLGGTPSTGEGGGTTDLVTLLNHLASEPELRSLLEAALCRDNSPTTK